MATANRIPQPEIVLPAAEVAKRRAVSRSSEQVANYLASQRWIDIDDESTSNFNDSFISDYDSSSQLEDAMREREVDDDLEHDLKRMEKEVDATKRMEKQFNEMKMQYDTHRSDRITTTRRTHTPPAQDREQSEECKLPTTGLFDPARMHTKPSFTTKHSKPSFTTKHAKPSQPTVSKPHHTPSKHRTVPTRAQWKPRTSGICPSTQGKLTITHNYRRVTAKTDCYQSKKYDDFASMSDILRPELIDGCDQNNFVHPSKIQAEAIPRCLSNGYPNLIAQAHHGSGKTATFSLVMLQRIDENDPQLQGLVLVHSRELAIQTFTVYQSLGQFISGLKMCLALKGSHIASWNAQICVGTPGSIIGKIFNAQRRKKSGLQGFLSSFKCLVVDEADEFLIEKQKFRKNSRSAKHQKFGSFGNLFDQLKMIATDIEKHTESFQTLLFSATYPSAVKKLAIEIAPKAFIIKVAQKHIQLDNIKVYKMACVDEEDKFNTLIHVISLANVGQMIVFVNTVFKAKKLIDRLEGQELGIACSALYGRGMDIGLRDKTMDQFRKNQTQCLVASNVIARGIDVPAVCLVVNFEIPKIHGLSVETGAQGFTFDSETFMHRVGRTGRFGTKGVCINLIAKDNKIAMDRLDAIQKEYSLNIEDVPNTTQDIKVSITSWLGDVN
eukprot:22022_1